MDVSLLVLTIEKLQAVPNEYDEAELILQIIPVLVIGNTDISKRLDLDWDNIQGIRIAQYYLTIPQQFYDKMQYPQVWIRPIASNLYIPIGLSILTNKDTEYNIKWEPDETQQDELIPALTIDSGNNDSFILNAPLDTEQIDGYTLYSNLLH